MTTKRKICFVTGTRADYGIMSRLMKRLSESPAVQLSVIATNMHLSARYGLTYKEIEADGITIDRKVDMILPGDSAATTVKSMGLAMTGMADAFDELKPDLAVILGDRYEMLVAASAAQIFGIPVAHIHGGEITEGAYDDSIRHAITKLSYLHFTSTEEYRKRVIQMGEEPDRVFNVGSLAVESIVDSGEKLMSLDELEKSLNHTLGNRFLVVTYHPVTKEPGSGPRQIEALLEALESDAIKPFNVLFTLPNSDTGSQEMTDMIKRWCEINNDRAIAVTSLGRLRYYSALNLCTAVVGNSSSGIIEAPSFRIPTLNIGARQKGRAQGNTVFNCEADLESVKRGLQTVTSNDTITFVRQNAVNPYYKPGTLETMERILTEYPLSLFAAKKFYDL